MNCDRIEELLPGYADGDITADEKRLVDTHVEHCETCRESLAFFMQMESQLVERRELRPSATVAAHRVTHRLGLRKRLGWFDALASVPGAIAGALVAFGAAWLLGGHAITTLVNKGAGVGVDTRADAIVDQWVRGVDSLAAGSSLTLPIVTAGLTALILLAGSWMVLRFVRE
jgi:anti-sigma factor RsiW